MEITKEALLERGFEYTPLGYGIMKLYAHPLYITYYSDESISINCGSETNEHGDYIEFPVPNCKTLEDLDHLIRLFS